MIFHIWKIEILLEELFKQKIKDCNEHRLFKKNFNNGLC